MDKLYSPTTIEKIKKRHNFRFSKSLGQNFLTDGNVIDKIIEGAQIGPGDLVIEIGPGIGVLTAAAAELAGRVCAVEIDSNLIPILKETLVGYRNIEVINQDILKTDVKQLIEDQKQAAGGEVTGVKIIGNLPYYITTPIIMKLLEEGVPADSITIMMQKEVADRLKAGAGAKDRGAISAVVQYYCEVNRVAIVSKEVFFPKPKVDSAVLRLDIRKEKPVELASEKAFFACIKAGFGQRRKTLSNSLTGVWGKSKEEVLSVLREADIDPSRRAETLSMEEFARLANALAGGVEITEE